jgi:hypothetical protein
MSDWMIWMRSPIRFAGYEPGINWIIVAVEERLQRDKAKKHDARDSTNLVWAVQSLHEAEATPRNIVSQSRNSTHIENLPERTLVTNHDDASAAGKLPWWIQALLVVFSLCALVGAVLRLLGGEGILKRVDGTTLTYLGVAAALLLLRDVKSLAFGDYKVEFERAIGLAREAKNAAENAQAVALGPGRQTTASRSREIEAPDNDDPWKGKFGGKPCSNDRCLEAVVEQIGGNDDLYEIDLQVRSTNPDKPLSGVVQFFLHPTFNNPTPIVKVGPNGKAELKLRAWGAFTAGALADGGVTKLELDLAKLESAPMTFRSK